MNSRTSLGLKFTRAFGLLVAGMSLAWAFVVIAGVRLAEDRVLVQQLEMVAQDYILQSSATNDPNLPLKVDYIRRYNQPELLPDVLSAWASHNPEPGYYEFQDLELHVAVKSAGSPPQPIYFVFEVAGIEDASSEDLWWIAALFVVGVALTAAAVGLGVVVSRRVTEPMTRLAMVVKQMDPEHLSDEDLKRIRSEDYADDEVGLLARTTENLLHRIGAFVDREHYFTRAASHELRTPVTVMRGALEVIDQNDMSPGNQRALSRIQRATDDMQRTIETFLYLSRETPDVSYHETFLVIPIVEQAIQQHRHLLEGKHLEVDFSQIANPELFGHPRAFAIVVNNLVRNAFEHSPPDARGRITIRVESSSVHMRNPCDMTENDANQFPQSFSFAKNGYGLGLDIVRRLCDYNGWTFVLSPRGNLVDTEISWSPASAGNSPASVSAACP